MKLVWSVLILLATLASAQEEHEGEEASARTGAGKAIISASHDEGLQLSPAALKRLGIRTTPLPASPSLRVPLSSLVYSQDEVSVYRRQDNHFQRIEVVILKKEAGGAIIRSEELSSGDQIVTSGAAFLRVAELDSLGGQEEGHGH